MTRSDPLTKPRSIHAPAIGWLIFAAATAAHQFFLASLGSRTLGTAVGIVIVWSSLCAGAAALSVRARREERRLVESGMAAQDAIARSASWLRRRGVVALCAGAAAAVLVSIIGVLFAASIAGVTLGIGLGAATCLMFAMILTWVELRKGTPVGSGAHCARCGYPTTVGLGGVCTECSQKFSFTFNLTEGKRMRPRWLKVAGITLPIVAVASLFVTGGFAAPRLVRIAPTETLIHMVENSRRNWASAASGELARRTLTPEQVEAFEQAVTRSVLPPGVGPATPP